MKGILQNGSISVSLDKTENTGFVLKANSEQNPASSAVEVSSISHLPNSKKTLQPQKMKPMEPLNSFKEASMKCRFLSEIGTTSGVPNSPKKSISIDPCELSIADRKALFERNKGQAPLPKAPYSQALPAQKKENGKPPIALPAKPPPIHVENKLIDRNIPARGTCVLLIYLSFALKANALELKKMSRCIENPFHQSHQIYNTLSINLFSECLFNCAHNL